MPRPIRVLHLEDSPRDAEMVRHKLDVEGLSCDIVLANNRDSFEAALTRESFDLIISDYNLPGYDGVTALKQAQETQPDVPVILISGTVGEEEAVRCLQIGATDYLLKARLDRLVPAVQRAIHEAETRRKRKQVEHALLQREQTLRENEERTRFALAAARMGVWEIDFATNRLTWSDTMAPVFGLTPDKAPTTIDDFFQLIHPDDRSAAEASFAKAIAGEGDYEVQCRAIWPDGSAHWVHGRAQVSCDADGKPLRLLGISMDIDERKSLEEQLRQAQKMEAVGQLAGGIAHDFNNLLTAILGYGELLTDQIGPDVPLGRDLREITRAAQRAAALTRQLLAFSRKQVLTVTALDLNQVVRTIEAMLRRLIGEHITVTTLLADDLDAVMVDATQFEQVLMNLALNARDAMPHGGELTIRTWNAKAGGDDADLWVRLSVTDTGTGMPPELQARIFEPFFTTKERGQGTGLGLAAVHGIVTQLHGSIAVESALGHGTTFRIDLPATRAAVLPSIAATTGPAPVGVETILLVEDERGVRAFITVALKRFGYQVLEAESAESALVLVEQNGRPIHLLLSDVILPKMGGRELAERLGRVRPGLRVLFMSGYTEQITTAAGFLEPGVQLLEKPFTAHALLTKVRHLLDAPASCILEGKQ